MPPHNDDTDINPSSPDSALKYKIRQLEKENVSFQNQVEKLVTTVNSINKWISEHHGKCGAYWKTQHKRNEKQDIDLDTKFTSMNKAIGKCTTHITSLETKMAKMTVITAIVNTVLTAILVGAVAHFMSH